MTASATALRNDTPLARLTQEQFAAISRMVSQTSGINLTIDKLELVNSRLQKRLRHHGLSHFGDYLALVQDERGSDEFMEMISALTTNVTSFHREPHHFEHFASTCIPAMKRRLDAGEAVRIWSAGCSNGAEPYNLAGVILDHIPDADRRDIRILATDLDPKSIEAARRGRYGQDFLAKLPQPQLKAWFDEVGGAWQVKQKLRSLVHFDILNLMAQWPMKKKYDAIFCRNVMIYFTRETQDMLAERFAAQLKEHAFLYIGHSERVGGKAASRFKPVGITMYERV